MVPSATLHETLPAVRQRHEVSPPAVPVRDLWVSCLRRRPRRTVPHMTKRILAAFLWFYTGWYAGAMLAEILSVSPVLGPIIGAAAAGLIVGDPRGMIWKRRPSVRRPPP